MKHDCQLIFKSETLSSCSDCKLTSPRRIAHYRDGIPISTGEPFAIRRFKESDFKVDAELRKPTRDGTSCKPDALIVKFSSHFFIAFVSENFDILVTIFHQYKIT